MLALLVKIQRDKNLKLGITEWTYKIRRYETTNYAKEFIPFFIFLFQNFNHGRRLRVSDSQSS